MSLFGQRLRRALSLSSAVLHRISATSHSLLPPRLPPATSPSLSSRSFGTCFDFKNPKPQKISFQGCDYNHWLIVVDFPKYQKHDAKELINFYEETAAKIFGSVEEAKKKIYACSTTDYIGFQVECDGTTSAKFKDLPGVLLVLPDSYIDAEKKEYGGDKYINGQIIPKSLPPESGLLGSRNDFDDGLSPKGPMEEEVRNDGPPMISQQNSSLLPPPNRNIEGENRNDSTPVPHQPSFSLPRPPNWNPEGEKIRFSPLVTHFGALPPQQNYDPPCPPQQWCGPPLQNFSTPSSAQWSSSPPFSSSTPMQNYGPSHPPQQQYGSPLQNFSVPPPTQPNVDGAYNNYSLQWSPSPPQQNYGPPHPPQQQYSPHQQNFNTPSPAQWSPSPPTLQENFGPSPLHQNYTLPHPLQQQYFPPSNFSLYQNFSMPPPPPPQQNMYANPSPPVTSQQNIHAPSPPQWTPSPPWLQQSFGPSPAHQNYGSSYAPQQQHGPPLQNISMPPAAQSNMVGVYTNYSMPVTPQQNFSAQSPAQWSPSPPHQNYGPPYPPQQQYSPYQQNFNTPSPAQWSASPPTLQQNFGPSPLHQNYTLPHPLQQQYFPPSNFSLYQNNGSSHLHNFGPLPQQQN